jgi:hypothetical protein
MLTTSTGTWTGGASSFAYQWQRSADGLIDWLDITGAIDATHVITIDDSHSFLRSAVVATNNTGDSLPAYSLATIQVPDEWFIVETGTGNVNAVSLCSNEDADLYHARRGNTSWTQIAHTEKHGLLVKATEYITQVYRRRWQGERNTSTQALDWPRTGVVVDGFALDTDIVPLEVKKAVAELALRASTMTLLPDEERAATREKVGPIETEYSEFSSQTMKYKMIDSWLAPYLSGLGSGGQYGVSRT